MPLGQILDSKCSGKNPLGEDQRNLVESIMNDIEHLHQIILNLTARLQATEAMANAAIAMICETDEKGNSAKARFLTQKFPALLKRAANAPAQATKPELDAWLRQREQDFLNTSLKDIIAQLEHAMVKSKTDIN